MIIDATGSRRDAWDAASRVTAQMFDAAAATGNLALQLVYFNGGAYAESKCEPSSWFSAAALAKAWMAKVKCEYGPTQYENALKHALKEHKAQPIAAVVTIGDAFEEELDDVLSLAGVNRVPKGNAINIVSFQNGCH